MFEDFHPAADVEAARRRSSSLAAAVLLYGGLFGVLIIATAAVKKVAEAVDDLPEIIFVPPPPEPQPPPAQPQPAVAADPSPRRPARRPRITPPSVISNDKPTESNRDLPASEAAGPVEGSLLGGGGGGTGQGSLALVPTVSLPPVAAIPIARSFANRPRYPRKAIDRGIEGVVVVEVEITAAGTVRSVRAISGPPELIDMVLRWAASWRYEPATRDGKPIASRRRESIRFRLEDAL